MYTVKQMKFSNARRVLSQCNTRLRLLHLLNNQRHVRPTTRRLRLMRLRTAVPATGFLVFCAVAEARISSKSAKSCEIYRNRKIPRKSLKIVPNTYRYNIIETSLGCWSCLLDLLIRNILITSCQRHQ